MINRKLIFSSFVGIVLSLITISGNVSAQNRGRIVTPFTPRVLDSAGRKFYVEPQDRQQSAISVVFGYGFSPVTSYNKYSHKMFPYQYNDDMGIVESNIGAISVGVNAELTPWLELNISFLYSTNKGRQPFLNSEGIETHSDPFSDFWISLLPSLRINWMRNNWLSVYTRAGMGLGLANRENRFSSGNDELIVTSRLVFAYQISPIGIEMGKGKFNFFVEGGYGHTGMVTAGLKLKVGGKNSTGRHVDWYDKYLD